MAFDMYCGSEHQAIRDADEYVFTLARESASQYPCLHSLSSRFYSQFSLEPSEAEQLVHELLALYAAHSASSGKGFGELTLRLASFFSQAYRAGAVIKCAGD